MPLSLLVLLAVVWAGSEAASSRFRYISGFFVQGDTSKPLPASNPPRFGLVEGKSWQDVHSAIDKGEASIKLVIFLRHGEGTHNVAIEKFGIDAWNAHYCKLPEYLDAPLTANGVDQAEQASKRLETEVGSGLRLEHILISPLERALKTFTIAYQNQISSISSTALELPREILGVETCNERHNISEKKLQYPKLNFNSFESDADPWWTPDHRESETQVATRATKLLDTIFRNISAHTVGVVSHSVFGSALLRVIGHRDYSLGTAEFLPLLIEELSTT